MKSRLRQSPQFKAVESTSEEKSFDLEQVVKN